LAVDFTHGKILEFSRFDPTEIFVFVGNRRATGQQALEGV
jgi:hypothetical protein